MKKIGFIGFGNMAQAIITGMITSGSFNCEDIGAYDRDEIKLKTGTEKLGITAFSSNEDLVSKCDCIVLAVKPITLQSLLLSLQKIMCKVNPLVISIAAGQSIDRLKKFSGYEAKIVRVMPNINAIAGKAVSGYAFSENVTEDNIGFAVKVLESFGAAVKIGEDKFSAYSAIAGCSPAYSYLFADAVAGVGVKYGLTKSESLQIVTSSIINTENKSDLTDNQEFENVVFKAIEAAYKKDKGM